MRIKYAPAVTFLLLCCAPLIAQNEEPPRTIAVRGEAEIKVTPDEVVLTLGVETNDMDLETAKKQNDEKVSEVLDICRRHEVPDKRLQTDYLQIEPRYRDRYEARNFLGYWVRRTVVVTLRDVDGFEALLSDVLRGGANYVHGISFRTTELRKHRDKARALAVAHARDKARLLAAALDQKVGAPLTISEGYGGWVQPYGRWWGARGPAMSQMTVQADQGSDSGSAIAPGQISITAGIQVTFELK